MRTPNNTPNHEFPQQILLRKALNMHPTIMTSSTTAKQPLGERSSNIPSPTKSPSKVPLPPSPRRVANKDAKQTTFAEETGAMDQMFRASTLLQQPELARKISEAHNNGQTYVSPSDAILSPTTKKLSDVKSRRIGYVTIHRLLRQLSNINTDFSSNFKKSSSLYDSQNLFKKSTATVEGSTRDYASKP